MHSSPDSSPNVSPDVGRRSALDARRPVAERRRRGGRWVRRSAVAAVLALLAVELVLGCDA
ncbi:hypothetical protein ACFPZ3_66730, partial [Nonomuraea insulae]